jgi:3-oxoacyl-[acyl-carrier protein] reductase
MNGEVSGVAVVTGAARNIGREIALQLAAAGNAVIVNARSSANEVADVVRAIEAAGGRAAAHLADVSEPAGAQSLMEAAIHHFGQIDILVNNAALRREVPFAELDFARWREVMSVILDGAYLCAHAALPYLRQSKAGAIVNIGGMSAHAGSAGRAHVIAAKAGLVGLTRALAHDLGPDGITVNCVVPGIGPARSARRGGEPGAIFVRPDGTLSDGAGNSRERWCFSRLIVPAAARKTTPRAAVEQY